MIPILEEHYLLFAIKKKNKAPNTEELYGVSVLWKVRMYVILWISVEYYFHGCP